MNRKRFHKLSAALLVPLTLTALVGCTSSTVIRSTPTHAKVYIDGVYRGRTPYTYSDTKIVGATTTITLKKAGYEEVHARMSRNEEFSVGACIGGVLVLVPFLWIMGYHPEHNFPLEAATTTANKPTPRGAF